MIRHYVNCQLSFSFVQFNIYLKFDITKVKLTIKKKKKKLILNETLSYPNFHIILGNKMRVLRGLDISS